MKFLLVLAAVVFGIWLWKHNRPATVDRSANPTPNPSHRPTPMQACALCGTHMPAQDMVTDHQGRHYCCAEHRQQASTTPSA